jgi:phosphoribosyl 1,2-cyclic phosphate phosphodiesterase
MRSSAYIQADSGPGGASILIDIGPDFRAQALANHITALDAVLLTHSHADHLHGIDDLHSFSHTCPKDADMAGRVGLPVYSTRQTLDDVRRRFSYFFTEQAKGGGIPKVDLRSCEQFTPETPLVIGVLEAVYIPLLHGSLDDAGWVVSCIEKDGKKHSIAYLTDCNFISKESIARIKSAAGILDHVVIDGLRERAHPTHLNFNQALEYAIKIGGKNTWVTHICHDMTHKEITTYFEERKKRFSPAVNILPAYDGLRLATGV